MNSVIALDNWNLNLRKKLEKILNMVEKLRVGVVGASWYSDLRHLPALKSHPKAETVAICDILQDRAEGMAKKFDIPFVSTDYREVIEKGDLDALFVVTPDNTHHAITMAALEAGLHVMCEKPLAHNAGQAREMYEKAEALGIKHMTFFSFRWPPHYRYLKELIDEGYVGRCFDCHITLFTDSGRGGRYSWRYDSNQGNGMLSEYGAHMIDQARWLIGDIAKVNAHLRMFLDRPGLDGGKLDPTNDSVLMAIEFENGAQGSMQLSSLACLGASGWDQCIDIHGESGTLKARATKTSAEILGIRDKETEFRLLHVPDSLLEGVDVKNPFDIRSQFAGVYLFVENVLEDMTITPSFHDGLKAQEVIDAAKKSDKTGQWVSP
ncbi:MAG: Gfo/Idh/MocA family oxidoreductase [Methanomassiliicoccales archaeon]|nr:Gfo/Idh/MocA family oxidoreductase [Methanomassiliicoccales archaeon]